MSFGFDIIPFLGESSGVVMNDRFTQLGTISRESNTEFTIVGTGPNWLWNISGANYLIDQDLPVTIPEAEVDKYRTDIVYVKTADNTIVHLQGDESDVSSASPIVPPNCLLLATWFIFGDIISDPILPVDGDVYVRKSFSNEKAISGTPTTISLSLADGTTAFSLSGGFVLDGFTFADPLQALAKLYDGKFFTIYNSGDEIITLANHSGVDVEFNFQSADYKLQPNELVLLRYSIERGLEFFSSNYSERNNTVIIGTHNEIKDLAQASLLVPGLFYQITDADINLYGGTAITLQAVSANTLNTNGVGRFYNPKYEVDFGITNIWMNYLYPETSNIIGKFHLYETVDADNGAKAIFLGKGLLKYTSGNWDDAVSITGASSGATADIIGQFNPGYAVDKKVVWGGKHWINTSGNLGSADSIFELSSDDWDVIEFNADDYNEVWDPIEYDFENDLITYRREILGGNSVRTNKEACEYFELNSILLANTSPIKYFQWGNCYQADTEFGIGNNSIEFGLYDCINFVGLHIYNETVLNLGAVYNNVFDLTSYLEGNVIGVKATLKNCVFQKVCDFSGNNLGNSASINAILAEQGASINNNKLGANSEINEFYLMAGSAIHSNDFETLAVMENGYLDENINLNKINFKPYSYFSLASSGKLTQDISNLIVSSECSVTNDLSGATTIYLGFNKTIVQDSALAVKLTYIKNTGVLTIESVDA